MVEYGVYLGRNSMTYGRYLVSKCLGLSVTIVSRNCHALVTRRDGSLGVMSPTRALITIIAVHSDN